LNASKKKNFLVFFLLVFLVSTIHATQIKQEIDELNYTFQTSSVLYVPLTASTGIIPYTSTDYDGTVTAYLEVVGKCDYNGLINSFGLCTVHLADLATGNEIGGSAINFSTSTATRKRSLEIDVNLTNTMFLQALVNNLSTSITIYASRLIIYQNGTISKTATYIPIGANNTSTTTDASLPLPEITDPKRWVYTSTDYDGTVTKFYGATLKTSNVLRYAKSSIHDIPDDVEFGTITTTSLSEAWVISSNMSLTSGNELTSTLARASSGTATATMRNSFLIIKQTGMNNGTGKLKMVMQQQNQYIERGSQAWGNNGIPTYNQYNPADWVNATITSKGEYVLKSKNAVATSYGRLTAGGTEIADSNIGSNSLSYVRITTGTLVNPSSTVNIDSETKTSNQSYAVQSTSARMILAITNLGTASPITLKKAKTEGIYFLNDFLLVSKKELNMLEGIILVLNSFLGFK